MLGYNIIQVNTIRQSIPLFENSTERRYCALVHNLLAIIYNESWMFPESLEHINEAYDYAIACGDHKLADIILRRKGVYYIMFIDVTANAIESGFSEYVVI